LSSHPAHQTLLQFSWFDSSEDTVKRSWCLFIIY
jgi:hypothetical protein